MIVDLLKDLLFADLELYAIIVIYHKFVLDFHRVDLFSGDVSTEEDLAEGALPDEIDYLVALNHVSVRVADVEVEIGCDTAEVRAVFSVGSNGTRKGLGSGISNARSFSI